MDQKEFEKRIKSPEIQDMILSNQIGGVAYELSKRLNVSPARRRRPLRKDPAPHPRGGDERKGRQ